MSRAGAIVAVAVTPGVGAAWMPDGGEVSTAGWDDAINRLREIEEDVGPRWLWWSGDIGRTFVANDIRPARCWDLEVIHRLLVGGWRAGPARIWAEAEGLDPDGIPERAPVDLFHQPSDRDDEALREDGHLDPEWAAGERADTLAHLVVWVELATRVYGAQIDRLEREGWGSRSGRHGRGTAHSRPEDPRPRRPAERRAGRADV